MTVGWENIGDLKEGGVVRFDALIVGCGYTGMALGEQLHQEGLKIAGVKRRKVASPFPLATTNVGKPHKFLQDLRADLGEGCRADTIYYLVAAKEFSPNAYRAAYLDGLNTVLESCQALQVRRVVFVSSTSVYGDSLEPWVDEATPARPKNFSGEILLEAEQTVLASPFQPTVVRFSGIYGPGRRRLIDQVCSGEAKVTGKPFYTNRIHRDDCAGVLRHLRTTSYGHNLYLGTDCKPATKDEVIQYIASICQVEARHRDTSEPPPPQRRSSKRLSNKRLLDSGYLFKFPTFREGYRAILP